jgi:RNA polymerase sigma factor (sigma-70 family)
MFDQMRLKQAMKQLKNGHNDAIDVIYDITNRMVFYQIYQIVKRKDVAEEIMQDVYMKVFEHRATYQEDQPKSWIMRIAKNEAINHYHKQSRETLVDVETLNQPTDDNRETPLIDMASQILDEDEFYIVMQCIIEGKTRQTVANALHLSTSGVTFKLNVALEKLKSQLEGGTNHVK